MWQGRWITAYRQGNWEYAARTGSIKAAVILALTEGDVLLVEQYRVPLRRRSIELPAGLIGDDAGGEDDDPYTAARRELLEETGYRARQWQNLGEYYSSPGMVSEGFTLLKATELTKVGAGGGVDGEDITVHRVPLAGIAGTITAFREAGLAIDTRMLMLLGPAFIANTRP